MFVLCDCETVLARSCARYRDGMHVLLRPLSEKKMSCRLNINRVVIKYLYFHSILDTFTDMNNLQLKTIS